MRVSDSLQLIRLKQSSIVRHASIVILALWEEYDSPNHCICGTTRSMPSVTHTFKAMNAMPILFHIEMPILWKGQMEDGTRHEQASEAFTTAA